MTAHAHGHHHDHDGHAHAHEYDHGFVHGHGHDPHCGRDDWDHHHGHNHHAHTHLPPGAGGAAVSWRALIGLGVSGGLLPCPAALVLLLTAISVGRTGLGVLLVLAFSVGLAGILTAVGLLFIKGSSLLRGFRLNAGLIRYVPALSAMVVFMIGVFIAVTALNVVFRG